MSLRNAPRSLLDREILRARPATACSSSTRAGWRATRSCSSSSSEASWSPCSRSHDPSVFAWLVAIWLWFTVLFANFAEAVAEGRGKAQADELRKTRAETIAHRRRRTALLEDIPSSQLRLGDEVVVSAGEVIPADGNVIEGIASVDESAITGESAPVIRESGGDRSAVTGGTRVLSDGSSSGSRRSRARASSTA